MTKNKQQYFIWAMGFEDTPEHEQLRNIFANVDWQNTDEAVVPRGGDGFQYYLGIALAFAGSAYAAGFIGAIAADHYKIAKVLIKKSFRKVRQPRHVDWPTDFPTPYFCGLTIQVETPLHSFIIDFDVDSLESLDKALDTLPSFLEALTTNTSPTHHLLLWDRNKWLVNHSHPWKPPVEN